MCLIVFAHRCHPRFPLIVSANRDEFYSRATKKAKFWKEYPHLLAGKDLKNGGTWMGITRDGRFAAVTNYREIDTVRQHTHSRGMAVLDFCTGSLPPPDFLERIRRQKAGYNGFNLICGNMQTLFYYSNRKNGPEIIEPGIHSLSNHLLDTKWPKSVRIRKSFLNVIEKNQYINHKPLMDILLDKTVAQDDQLPDTGFSKQWERLLSPVFVSSETYGTRNSTVILVDNKGCVVFAERSFHYSGDPGKEVIYEFQLPGL